MQKSMSLKYEPSSEPLHMPEELEARRAEAADEVHLLLLLYPRYRS